MNKKFAVFDMDGTLVDSMGYWQRMERECLLRRGAKAGPRLEALIARLKPMTLLDAARIFIAELGFSGTPDRIVAEMNESMRRHYERDVPLKPGVKEYLCGLVRRGAALCTASATDTPLVELCLRRLGVDREFRFLLSCGEVGASKDRPDVYLEAARRLGSVPAETAVFEDSLSALTTAKNAGFYTVAVYDAASAGDWPALQALADECVADWTKAAAEQSGSDDKKQNI